MFIRGRRISFLLLCIIFIMTVTVNVSAKTTTEKVAKITDNKAPNLKIIIENCNVRIEKNSEKAFEIKYDNRYISVNTEKSDEQMELTVKRIKKDETNDFIYINLPDRAYKKVTVKGKEAGISLPEINAHQVLSVIDGAMSTKVPKGFNKSIKLNITNGAGSLEIDKKAEDYSYSINNVNLSSSFNVDKQFPDKKLGEHVYRYKNGNGKAKIKVTIKKSAFHVDLTK